jgi:hypothetical protein
MQYQAITKLHANTSTITQIGKLFNHDSLKPTSTEALNAGKKLELA